MQRATQQITEDQRKRIENEVEARYSAMLQQKTETIARLQSRLSKSEQTAEDNGNSRIRLRAFIRSVWQSRVPATPDDKARGYAYRVMVDGALAREWDDI